MKNERGITPIDFVFILTIVILSIIVLARAGDAYQAYFRFSCYDNQQIIDKALWDFNFENKREVWEVECAYTIKYPDRRDPVMVVIYQPRVGEYNREILIKNLEGVGGYYDITCPLNKRTSVLPVINYWFMWGKWHCLYNQFHSQ